MQKRGKLVHGRKLKDGNRRVLQLWPVRCHRKMVHPMNEEKSRIHATVVQGALRAAQLICIQNKNQFLSRRFPNRGISLIFDFRSLPLKWILKIYFRILIKLVSCSHNIFSILVKKNFFTSFLEKVFRICILKKRVFLASEKSFWNEMQASKVNRQSNACTEIFINVSKSGVSFHFWS